MPSTTKRTSKPNAPKDRKKTTNLRSRNNSSRTVSSLRDKYVKRIIVVLFVFIFAGLGVYLLRDTQAHVYNCGTLRAGSQGTCVKYMQRMFNGVNKKTTTPYVYYQGTLIIDGNFGSITATAIKSFQTKRGLVADGIVGSNTWDALCSATMSISTSSSAANYPLISDGINAGRNAGCHGTGWTTASTNQISRVNLAVLAHPDDEMQVWSQLESTPNDYKVIAFMTRGDETGYCVTSSYTKALRTDLGEVATRTIPQGKWSASCKESRMESTVQFINKMGTIDSTIPSGLSLSNYKTLTLSTSNTSASITRNDNGSVYPANSARVYPAPNGYGIVVFFDLGDGDLTSAEVSWAIRSLMSNRGSFGVPSALPIYNVYGNFAHSGGYASCKVYAHPDHKAIHSALYSIDLKTTGSQSGATCATDPDAAINKTVSSTIWAAAMRVDSSGHRSGFFQKYYGWLDGNTGGWIVDNSTTTQNHTFMRKQSFWKRF